MATSCDLTPSDGLLGRSCQRVFSRLWHQEHLSRCTFAIALAFSVAITIINMIIASTMVITTITSFSDCRCHSCEGMALANEVLCRGERGHAARLHVLDPLPPPKP